MRVYARLLAAYPPTFRARFGPGLTDAFAGGLERACRNGRLATIRFWIATAADTCWFGMVERVAPSLPASHHRSLKGLVMRSLVFDWRDALRSLRATPIVTAVAVLSVALGVGANTALFSLLDGLVLKALPVRDPAQLVLLDKGSWTNPIWEQIRDRPDLFDGAFAWSPVRFDMSDHGESNFVDGMYASGHTFDVLGVPALLGRTLRPADDARDGGPDGPVAVISYHFWQRQFAGTPDVIGRSLTLSHVVFTIVGVAPVAFAGPDVGRTNDIFVPLNTEALIRGKESGLDARSNWWLQIMARMKPTQTIADAEAALRGVQPQIREATIPPGWSAEMLKGYLSDAFAFVPAETGRSNLRQRFEEPLVAMLVVVGLVLLIACANIANLLLARATARRQDISVRLALGASRFRLARQLLAESLLLAVAGGLLGIGVAKIGSALLVRQLATPNNPVSLDLSIDWRVFAFAASITLVTAVFFGLGPALAATRVSPSEALKAEGRSITGDRKFGLRNILVVTQVALSLVLVVAAGLFTRTFSSLVSAPLGFNPAPLVLVNVNIRQNTAAGPERLALVEHLRDVAAGVPGVRSAALSVIAPLSGSGWNTSVEIDGPNGPEQFGRTYPWVNAVTPGWFDTYGMRLVGGRDFTTADRSDTPRSAVVNQAFVTTFFHGANPLGRVVKAGMNSPDGADAARRRGRGQRRGLPIAARGHHPHDLHSVRRTEQLRTWRGAGRRGHLHALGRAHARSGCGVDECGREKRVHVRLVHRTAAGHDGAGTPRRDPRGFLRRTRPASRRAGTLRRHLLRGESPPNGNRRADGPRRPPARRSFARPRTGRLAGEHRDRGWCGHRAVGRALHRHVAALRSRRARSHDVHWRRARPGRGRRPRGLAPGTARVAHRSDTGVERGIGGPVRVRVRGPRSGSEVRGPRSSRFRSKVRGPRSWVLGPQSKF